jgi:dTDP-4-dehydrorhamnose 3,5-epimerase
VKLVPTPIAGVYEALSTPARDHRGQFARLFCVEAQSEAHAGTIKQINHSLTCSVGAVRGLHFQYPPKAEAKWVRCLRGRVFDIAVDLRRGSATFLAWHATELDAERMNALIIPEGCAHGFQVLVPDSELLYLHTESYSPAHEGGVRYDDPRLAIRWPLPVTDLSERDLNHPLIDSKFPGIST